MARTPPPRQTSAIEQQPLSHLESLPQELFDNVCQHLHVEKPDRWAYKVDTEDEYTASDSDSLRLTSRVCDSKTFKTWLHAHFTKRCINLDDQSSLESAIEVAEHPVFSRTVRKLYLTARILDEDARQQQPDILSRPETVNQFLSRPELFMNLECLTMNDFRIYQKESPSDTVRWGRLSRIGFKALKRLELWFVKIPMESFLYFLRSHQSIRSIDMVYTVLTHCTTEHKKVMPPETDEVWGGKEDKIALQVLTGIDDISMDAGELEWLGFS